MNARDTERKSALITGASRGIGHAFARLLAGHGYDIAAVARDEKTLLDLKDELASAHGTEVTIIPADLTASESALRIYGRFMNNLGAPHILVNNAGFGSYGAFAESDWETEESMIQLNILALTQLTRLFLPHMIERNIGRILNIASTASFRSGPFMAVYFATKAYVLSFSEALAVELAGTGVTVTALCPGPTKTGFDERAGVGTPRLSSLRSIPSPDEVALFGYRRMMEGRPVAVHGFANRLMVSLLRLMPRSAVRRLSGRARTSR